MTQFTVVVVFVFVVVVYTVSLGYDLGWLLEMFSETTEILCTVVELRHHC